MDLRDILSVSIASLLVLVIAHVAVFWIVRTLYPPASAVVPVPAAAPAPPAPQQVFTQPAIHEQETVNVPTYQAPVQLEAAREEGSNNFTYNPSMSAAGDAGVARTHA